MFNMLGILDTLRVERRHKYLLAEPYSASSGNRREQYRCLVPLRFRSLGLFRSFGSMTSANDLSCQSGGDNTVACIFHKIYIKARCRKRHPGGFKAYVRYVSY